MVRPFVVLIVGTIVLGLASVSALVYVGSHQNAGSGGVYGVIVAGPAVPVCRLGQNCNVNMQGYTLVFMVHCSVGLCAVKQTTTLASDGSYSVSIPAGVYDISMQNCPWLGCSRTFPITVSVGAGLSVNVSANIDTGIR